MASHKTLLIPLIQEILVKEIGEANITPIKWTKLSSTRYKFLIDIGDFTETVSVDFDLIIDQVEKEYYFPPKYRNLNKMYNVGYEVSGTEVQFAKTNLKVLLTILSTVIDIVKDFIESQNPEGLYIRGSEKELGSGDISKKTNLYKAYLKKQVDQLPNYKVDTYRDGFIVIDTRAL
jgi:hypothetical protein